MFNVSMKLKHYFFPLVVFIFTNASCLWATSHSRTSILFCVMPTCLCNSMCFNSTSYNVAHIVPNSLRIPLEGEHWWMQVIYMNFEWNFCLDFMTTFIFCVSFPPFFNFVFLPSPPFVPSWYYPFPQRFSSLIPFRHMMIFFAMNFCYFVKHFLSKTRIY